MQVLSWDMGQGDFFGDIFTETCVCVCVTQTNQKRYQQNPHFQRFELPPRETAPFVAESVWVEVAPGRVVETKNWLVVSTHLKKIGQKSNGNILQIGINIKKHWNHHLEKHG